MTAPLPPEALPLPDATLEEVRDGAVVLEEGAAVSDLVWLVAGELEEWQQGRLSSIVLAPRPVALRAALDGGRSDASYRAAGDVTVARVARERLAAVAPEVQRWLGAELDALRRERAARLVVDDDFFLPEPGARLVPGPYHFGPFACFQMVVRTDPAALARLVPRGLHLAPGTDGRYLLAFTAIEGARVEHQDSARYRYHEVTPFVPCLTRLGKPAMFVPELYPDSYMAILLGREIYGFPKRLGRMRVDDAGLDLIVDDRRLLRARWGAGSELSLEDYGARLLDGLFPSLPAGLTSLSRRAASTAARLGLPLPPASVFVRRRILSERSEVRARYRIDELVEVPVVVEELSAPRLFPAADVRIQPGSGVVMGEVLDVMAVRLAFRFGAGKVRRRYPRDAR